MATAHTETSKQMPGLYAQQIDDQEYVARVRRHKPSSLVPLVASVAAQYSQHNSWLGGPFNGLFAPWALADIARVSLVMGNEHRSDAIMQDVLECAAAYAAVKDPDLLGTLADGRDKFILRLGFEQSLWQQPTRHELGRMVAILEQTTTSETLKVIQPGWEQTLFGCTLSQFIGIGFIAHTLAVKYSGRFSTEWLDDPALADITSQIPLTLMDDILAYHFVGDIDHFQNKRDENESSALRRFSLNPLLSQPIVSGIGNELLVPVPAMALRKVSSSGIWHMGFDRWLNDFAEDVGELFQQYVGRQLGTITEGQVLPEIVYNGNDRSVDWMVVGKQAVILIEVKSARSTEDIRLGSPTAWQGLADKLAYAFDQIANTDRLIAQGHPEFSHIPPQLPRLGLIVTMELFPFVNATPIRAQYGGGSVTIPTAVCSSNELEWLVSLQDRELDGYLLQFMNDPTKEGFGLTADLVGVEFGRNAVLDEAWASFGWARPPEATDGG